MPACPDAGAIECSICLRTIEFTDGMGRAMRTATDIFDGLHRLRDRFVAIYFLSRRDCHGGCERFTAAVRSADDVTGTAGRPSDPAITPG